MIINVFIASFSPAQGERNQMVNAKFTRPVNVMPMSRPHNAMVAAVGKDALQDNIAASNANVMSELQSEP